MTVIPVSQLSASDLSLLGHNVKPAVERDRDELAAVERSLATLGERLGPDDDDVTVSISTG